jgi:catechol 2,3-dioxygenase-like lactoylglutathione lyase family enzyme
VDEEFEPVETISAVTLVTVDMARSVAFYQALGLKLLYGGPEAAFTSFRVGAGYVNLQLEVNLQIEPPGGPIRPVWGRIIFCVRDVDAMHARIVAAGFRPEMSPADASWGERYFHVRDPDGHELSFARPLSPPGS